MAPETPRMVLGFLFSEPAKQASLIKDRERPTIAIVIKCVSNAFIAKVRTEVALSQVPMQIGQKIFLRDQNV
jgi:hypothetical protein